MKKRLGQAAHLGARQAWLWRNRDGFGETLAAEKPRLLIDVSAIIRHDAKTGIQRVVRAVSAELRRRDGIHFDLVPVYATSSHGYCYVPADALEHGQIAVIPNPVRVRRGDKFLGLDLSAHLLPKYRRQLRAWREHGATIHLVVYDLLPLFRPGWFTPSSVAHFRRWLDVVSEDADHAICISDQVASELKKVLSSSSQVRPRVGRLRMGADMAGSVPSTGLPDGMKQFLEHLRFRPAILMVGTVEPRKGYEAALAAFDYLWRTSPTDSPDLVMVGKAGWKTDLLQRKIRSHPEYGARLKWFESMSDEGLCLLYDACRGLFTPSRGEGWGLPLIEATMHRRYVLARDLPVFREHRLPNISYFRDDSPETLAPYLMELMERGQRPAPQTHLPTWSDSVECLLVELGITPPNQHIEVPLRKAS